MYRDVTYADEALVKSDDNFLAEARAPSALGTGIDLTWWLMESSSFQARAPFRGDRALYEPHLAPRLFEGPKGVVQVFLGQGGVHDGPDAGAVPGHHGEYDGQGEDRLLEEEST